MKNQFSKFDIASIKRTAANCSKYRTQKEKNNEKIAALQAENDKLQLIIDKWDAPIRELTGYSVEELTERVVNPETKIATIKLKYPETVIPVETSLEPADETADETSEVPEAAPEQQASEAPTI